MIEWDFWGAYCPLPQGGSEFFENIEGYIHVIYPACLFK